MPALTQCSRRPVLVVFVVLLAGLIYPGGLKAQSSAGPAAAPSTRPAAPSAIAPYLDDTTLAVARVDVDRIDWDAMSAWEIEMLKVAKMSQADLDKATAETRKQLPHIKKWTSDFVRAGGKKVYIVIRMNPSVPAYAVVPLAAGGNPKELGELLKDPFAMDAAMDSTGPTTRAASSPLAGMKSEVINKALFFGPAEALADVHNAEPVARPELDQAFASIGDAPVGIAFNPSEGLRGVMVMSVKKLPEEFGGGPITPVSSGLRWASLAVRPPVATSKLSLLLTIQAKNAASAKDLLGIIDAAHQNMTKQAGEKQAGPAEFLFATLAPKQAVDRPDQLRVSLDDAKLRDLTVKLLPAVLAARAAATQSQSASNERQIGMGIIMYANENKGAYPKDLQTDIAPYLGPGPKAVQNVFTNPLQPQQKNGYVYVRPANKITELRNPSEIPILYEAFDTWGAGVNVGFADGHVEFIKTKDAFDKYMKNNPNAAKAANVGGAKP